MSEMSPMTRDRIDRHERLLRVLRHAENHAELLHAAGNYDGAEAVRNDCRAVARAHDLDKILKGQ